MYKQLQNEIFQNERQLIEIRRYLHENPELSHQEVLTPKYIAAFYDELNIPYRQQVGGRGVVATLKGDLPGKTVALRADFDALAIEEQTEVPFKSKIPGIMHACGHDAHTASLLVAAKALHLMKEKIKGTIVFIHQFGEESPPGGAKFMIEDHCLDDVDAIFGAHIWAGSKTGIVHVVEGPIFAGGDIFEVIIKGKGGHGALPHMTKDSIVIAAQLVSSLQQIVSRKIDPLEPAVLSIGHIEALNPSNVIADSCILRGTIRAFSNEVLEQLRTEIEKFTQATCLLYDADYEVNIYDGYPPVINTKDEAMLVKEVIMETSFLKYEDFQPAPTAEDFAYYLQKIPGAFFLVGGQDSSWETVYPHHHPKFNLDESAMKYQSYLLASCALRFLETNI